MSASSSKFFEKRDGCGQAAGVLAARNGLQYLYIDKPLLNAVHAWCLSTIS